jgi:hypothetical protein
LSSSHVSTVAMRALYCSACACASVSIVAAYASALQRICRSRTSSQRRNFGVLPRTKWRSKPAYTRTFPNLLSHRLRRSSVDHSQRCRRSGRQSITVRPRRTGRQLTGLMFHSTSFGSATSVRVTSERGSTKRFRLRWLITKGSQACRRLRFALHMKEASDATSSASNTKPSPLPRSKSCQSRQLRHRC